MVHSSRPKRHFIKRKRGDVRLEERDPSLINLPFPLPSIPVISNLLDPLISGEKSQSSSSAQAATPTATSVSSSSGDSGNSSSGDDSTSSSGDDSASSSGNSGSVGSDTVSESGSSSSDSGSGSGSDNSDSSPTASSTASTATVATGKLSSFVDNSDSSSQGAVASASVASASSAAVPTGSVATEATSTNSANSADVESSGTETSTASLTQSSQIGNIAAAVGNSENDGSASSSAVQGAGTLSSHAAQATAIGTLGTGTGSDSSSNSGSDSTSGTDNTSSTAHASNGSAMSGGAIAGIILAVLVACGLLVLFVMRRRAISKRKAHQSAWFFGRTARPTNADPAARISTRSSWGTPYDSRAPYTDAMSPTPDSAPNTMAQLNSAPLTAPPVVVTQKSNSRASMYSIGSMSSEDSGSGEGLSMPAAVHGEDMPSTPMSVRPFSPSDCYSFPSPPSTAGSGPRDETLRRPVSISKLIDLDNPFEDPLPKGASPFADPVVPVIPGARTSVASSVSSAGSIIGIGTRVTIARSFTPSLHDEIGVSPGDEITVLQAFEDGWVQIRNAVKDVGLIPLDCLRPNGQDESAFLASKRVSSFFQAGFLQ